MPEQPRFDMTGLVDSIRQTLIMTTAIGGSFTLAIAVPHGVEYAFGLVVALFVR
ncbi:MAG: hypothetical protein HQL07_04015 [Nitrospirae bacterium]|nr:hypothetical protein [Magnetococcales bacterium]